MADSSFTCEGCKQPTTAPKGSVLALLQLCSVCQERRYSKGLEEQRKAQQREGKR